MTADPVPGLPESRLGAEHLAALPNDGPPGPWDCRVNLVLWIQRARVPQRGLGVDWLHRLTPLATAGFIEYLESPVGPYHEVFAGALLRAGLRPVLQVPFIAVDSLPSVRGGRVNWALPKTMATFSGSIAAAEVQASGAGWSAQVRPGRALLPIPRPVPLRFAAVGPLGRYTLALRVSGRIQMVHTQIEGETLTGWLGAGRRPAAVLTGRLQITPPRR
jgi:hypothetical protein